MTLIKRLARFINSLTLYGISYLMLAGIGMLPLIEIPGLTIESIPVFITTLISIGSVASLISDGIKKALLQFLVEGGLTVAIYGASFITGLDKTTATIFIGLPILIICIIIFIWKLATRRIILTWR